MRTIPAQPQVCFSGFLTDPLFEDYADTVSKHVGEYSGILSEATSILCVATLNTEKYKVARLRQSQIEIVTKDWIIDCHHKQKRVDPAKFLVKGLFYGLKMGIHGFAEEEAKRIIAKVTSEGGGCQVVDVEVLENSCTVECVLLSNSTTELSDSVNDLQLPLLSMEWFNTCVDKGVFLFPLDHSINCTELKWNSSSARLCKGAARAKEVMNTLPIDSKEFNFLEGCVFYIHGLDEKARIAIKQIISAYGGFYLEEFSSIHTHILSLGYTDEELKTFLKFGNFVRILKLTWLLDCVLTMTMLPDDSYLQEKSRFHFRDKTGMVSSVESGSFSFGNRNSFTEHMLSMKRGSSISITTNDRLKNSASKIDIKSPLFQGKSFFFIGEQKRLEQLKGLPRQIKEHSGNLPRELTRNDSFYLVMADSKDNPSLLKSFSGHFKMMTVVSHRWVGQCIKYNQWFAPDEVNRFIFRPFDMPTPVADLMRLVIDILGFDEVKRARIRELLNVIGNGSTIKKKEAVTHVICDPSTFKKQSRYQEYQELMKNNPKISPKFVRLEWVLECLNSQKLQPVDKYLVK